MIRSNSPTLDISAVSSDDEGTYSCVASNLAGQAEERLQVIVSQDDYSGLPSYPEDNRGGRPPGPAGQNVYRVELGNNSTLRADIVGNMADIEAVWKKEDGGQINGRYYHQGSVLYIINARREDAGVYICQGMKGGNVIFEYRAVVIVSGRRSSVSPLCLTALSQPPPV